MQNEIENLKKEIELIKSRNRLVENDKAWEVNPLRRGLIAVFTYLSISLYMWAVNIDQPFLNAIVPTVGFLLSTLTLPWFRKMWGKGK